MEELLAADRQSRHAFARRLHELRVHRVYSREALAARAGVSIATIGAYERGAREPPLSVLLRLARALRVTPDTLLGADLEEMDPALTALFAELRLARPEQIAMVREFWAYLKRAERGG